MALWIAFFRSDFSQAPLLKGLLSGRTSEAIRQGHKLMDTTVNEDAASINLRSLLLRCHLLFGTEQEADELAGELPRLYAKHQKFDARWLVALDSATLELHRHRPGRAVELLMPFVVSSPPPNLKIEGWVLLAKAYKEMGDLQQCETLLMHLQSDLLPHSHSWRLVEAARIDLLGHTTADMDLTIADLGPLVQTHLRWCQLLKAPEVLPSHLYDALTKYLAFCDAASAKPWSERARLSTGTRLLDLANGALAALALDPLVASEVLVRTHPLRADLFYCRARLLAHGGRYAEAFSWLNEYVSELDVQHRRNAVSRPQLPGQTQHLGALGDALAARLPVRYRRLISLIAQRVGDPRFGVQEMAAHFKVTERALQMACKNSLGMTPAQLLRHIRQHGLNSDLSLAMQGEPVATSANRWGLQSRAQIRSLLTGTNQAAVVVA